MTEPALTIQFSDSNKDGDVTPSTWLHLAQEYFSEINQDANLYDIAQMYVRARSGLSAKTYHKTDCPVLITSKDSAIVTLTFYVWPSRIDLPYTLTAGLGTISPPLRVSKPKEFDVLVPMSDKAELEYLLNDAQFSWQTPAINKFGGVISAPIFAVVNGQLQLSESVFVVLRCRGEAQGYKHSVSMQINGTGENKITNLHNSIIAAWVDDSGKTVTETLDLKIPDCVADALEQCPDGPWQAVGNTTFDEEGLDIATVYYSDCDGDFLGVKREHQS